MWKKLKALRQLLKGDEGIWAIGHKHRLGDLTWQNARQLPLGFDKNYLPNAPVKEASPIPRI